MSPIILNEHMRLDAQELIVCVRLTPVWIATRGVTEIGVDIGPRRQKKNGRAKARPYS